jgi:peptide-methionine (S)-S-oxide reductase
MSIFSFRNKSELIEKADALPGREEPIFIPDLHYVNGNSLEEIKNRDLDSIIFGMGCFWGAEKFFWELKGIVYTSVGYISGYTANATYEEVCSGMTGHNEVVEIIYSPAEISLEMILKTFWENHDPTQGMRQGNDIGTQYRSGIYFLNEPNLITIEESKNKYQKKLTEKNYGLISTEIIPAATYYYAEEYHQQYLAKNPNGYCGHGGCGISLDD